MDRNRNLVNIIKEKGIPHVYVEDDGTHSPNPERWAESIQFFSKFLGGGVVSVESRGKLATTWGKMKRR